MDQNSTNGTGIDKRNWRERLGIASKDMPRISDEFKAQPAEPPAHKPAPRAPQPVARPAPMAPRNPQPKPVAAAPAVAEVRRTAPAAAPSDALAEKLRAQRAAAEKLAEQRVHAARERAEARSSGTASVEPTLPIPRSAPPRPTLAEARMPEPRLSEPRAVEPKLAAPQPPPPRPKFSFADEEVQPRREPGGIDLGRPKLQRPVLGAGNGGPLLPPRPALGGERPALRSTGNGLRAEAPPAFRPIDPATGYPQAAGRSAAGYVPKRPLPQPQEVADPGFSEPRVTARAPALETRRRSAPPPPPPMHDADEEFDEEPRDPRLGRAMATRARSRGAADAADDVFEEDLPPQAPRRRASASEYHSAYREAEEGYDEDRRRSSGPWLLLLALLVAAVATGGIVWYYNTRMKAPQTATGTTNGTSESVPVVTAPEQPAKTAPESQATETLNAAAPAVSKKQIYDRIVGDQEVLGTEAEVVPTEVTPIQPEAQPVDQSTGAQIPEPTGSGTQQGTDEQLPLPLPPPPGENDTQGLLEQGTGQPVARSGATDAANTVVNAAKAQPDAAEGVTGLLPPDAAADSAATQGATATTQVQDSQGQSAVTAGGEQAAAVNETVSDSTAATDAAAESVTDTPPAPKPVAAKKKTATSKPAAKAKKPAASEAQSDGALGAAPVVLVPPGETASPLQDSGDGATAAPADQAAPKKKKTLFDLFKNDSSTENAAVPEERVVKVEPAPQTKQETAAPQETQVASLENDGGAAQASKPQAGGGNGFVVQLASFRSQSEAQAEYDRLKFKYPSVVGPLPSRISQATVGGSTRYRLGLGPLTTREEASKVCGNLFAAGERDCLVRTQ